MRIRSGWMLLLFLALFTGQGVAAAQEETPPPFVPLVTSTPQADGSIIHVVGEGDTLWSIAISYGVMIDDIRGWNNLPADSSMIFVGQRLLIHPPGAYPPIPAVEETITPAQTLVIPLANEQSAELTPSPASSATPELPALTSTISPSASAVPAWATLIPGVVLRKDQAAIILVLLAGIVVVVGVWLGFSRTNRR